MYMYVSITVHARLPVQSSHERLNYHTQVYVHVDVWVMVGVAFSVYVLIHVVEQTVSVSCE